MRGWISFQFLDLSIQSYLFASIAYRRYAEAESQAIVVMARELQKIDAFLSGAASDLSTAGLTIAHHVGTPGRTRLPLLFVLV